MINHKKYFVAIVIASLICFGWLAGSKYPGDYFRSPVDHEIKLSGTFGELRSNHFHSGIDIKTTNGIVGDPVYAPAKGEVARIKIQAGGYGNALYLSHPNGFSTVFAHLDEFAPELKEYVRKNQYKRESFEVNLYPEKGKFTFEKGQLIGRIGNSGSSSGPHLHFEVRETASQKPINPLLFNFPVIDKVSPWIQEIKCYHLDDINSVVNEELIQLKGDTIFVGSDKIGLGVKVYDQMDGIPNLNGVYSLNVNVDKEPYFDLVFEKFAFRETRYLNAHCDYGAKQSGNGYYHRLFRLPGNQMSMYQNLKNDGIIKLQTRKAVQIRIVSTDPFGNEDSRTFYLKRNEERPVTPNKFLDFIHFQTANTMKKEGLSLSFPTGSFYQSFAFDYRMIKDSSDQFLSPIHQLHHSTVPVHRYYTLAFEASVPPELRRYAFIGKCEQEEIINFGGAWEGNQLITKSRELGNYVVVIDSIAPTIKPVQFKEQMTGNDLMSFKVKDNMETGGSADGLKYRATVDGKWLLMEYDAKNDLLIHRFDGRILPGEHSLKITVSDNRRNTNIFKKSFII